MNSIFSSSFVENLKRIQGETERPSRSKSSGGDSFSEVLADIEQRQRDERKIPSNRSELGLQDAGSFERLESPRSGANYLVSADHPLFALPNGLLDTTHCITLGGSGECDRRVNAAPEAVKALPVEPSLTGVDRADAIARAVAPNSIPTLADTLEQIPEQPQIRAVTRTSYPVQRLDEPISYSRQNIEEIISTAGRYHGVDPDLSKAVAQAESSFRPDAVSQDGYASKGIFQLLDSTAGDLIGRFNVTEQYDPFDPAMNAFLGVGYLRRLHDLFSEESHLGGSLRTRPVNSASDLEKIALAAFNAGEGNVARAQAKAEQLGRDPGRYESLEQFLPPSTRTYVGRVTEFRNQFARARGAETIG